MRVAAAEVGHRRRAPAARGRCRSWACSSAMSPSRGRRCRGRSRARRRGSRSPSSRRSITESTRASTAPSIAVIAARVAGQADELDLRGNAADSGGLLGAQPAGEQPDPQARRRARRGSRARWCRWRARLRRRRRDVDRARRRADGTRAPPGGQLPRIAAATAATSKPARRREARGRALLGERDAVGPLLASTSRRPCSSPAPARISASTAATRSHRRSRMSSRAASPAAGRAAREIADRRACRGTKSTSRPSRSPGGSSAAATCDRRRAVAVLLERGDGGLEVAQKAVVAHVRARLRRASSPCAPRTSTCRPPAVAPRRAPDRRGRPRGRPSSSRSR